MSLPGAFLLHVLSLLLVNEGCWPKFSSVAVAANVKNVTRGNYEVEFEVFTEARRSLGSPCHEDGKQLPMYDAASWSRWDVLIETIRPVDYVVIRRKVQSCYSRKECKEKIGRRERGETAQCSMTDNFYIHQSGVVVEGRGWNVAPYFHLNGLREKSVTVRFLFNSIHEIELSMEARKAFRTILKLGIWQGKLSARHRIVSLGQIYNQSFLDDDKILNFTKQLKTWSDDVSLMSTWELVPRMSLSVVPREEWGAADPTKAMRNNWSPSKYVILTEGGERCYTQEECSAALKAEQAISGPKFGDLPENFYVGEDGQVYEGLGFNVVPFWHVQALGYDVITVRLFGKFQSEQPSPRAMGGLKILLSTGVWIGKISPGYKLYSLREVYDDREFLGDAIFSYAKDWNRWAVHLWGISLQERRRIGLLPLINRIDWDKNWANKSVVDDEGPATFVIIGNQPEFDRCYTLEECQTRMEIASLSDTVTDNFYVGDDGNSYEGNGWAFRPKLPHRYFNDSLVTIKFIGSSEEAIPSMPAIFALKRLLSLGVELKHLSPKYQLYSQRHAFDYYSTVSEDSYQRIESINKWYSQMQSTPDAVI